jgi:hypothetical protein
MGVIWGQRKAEYFSCEDWTTQNRLNLLENFLPGRTRRNIMKALIKRTSLTDSLWPKMF